MAAVCAEPEFVLNEKLGCSCGRGAVRAAGRMCAGNICVPLLPPMSERVRERGSSRGLRFQHLVSELGVLGVLAVPEVWQRWRRSLVAARWSSGPCVGPWR
ncbi:hypothetical protein VPH35_056765 [Triticum aestivum]